MKKIKYLYLVLLASVALWGCSDFEDLNKDDTKLPELGMSHVGAAFAYSQYWGMYADRYEFELVSSVMSNLYVQYFANVTPSFQSDRFAAPDKFSRRAWATYYLKALPQLVTVLHMTENTLPVAHAVALVWKVQISHRVADLYGAMPYSDANNAEVSVKYDSQEDVYKQMFAELDAAIAVLAQNRTANAFGTDDQIYGGSVEKWYRFANSLKLRLAMRISDVNLADATKYAEEAVAAGVMESADDDAFLIATPSSTTPYGWLSAWGETYMSESMQSVLVGYEDPRLPIFFNKPVDKAYSQNYRGARNGMNSLEMGRAEHAKNTLSLLGSRFSDADSKNTEPLMVMNAAESYFLRAEGAIKGWNMRGTAESLYEKGIECAMKTWSISDADIAAYIHSDKLPMAPGGYFNTPAMNQLPVKFSSDESEQLEQIAVQKWLALFPYNSVEMYADMRRTGRPHLYDRIHTDDETVGVDAIPARYLYPEDEITKNKAEYINGLKLLGGEDKITTRVWWNKK